jgi:hypothetical protein
MTEDEKKKLIDEIEERIEALAKEDEPLLFISDYSSLCRGKRQDLVASIVHDMVRVPRFARILRYCVDFERQLTDDVRELILANTDCKLTGNLN